MPLPNFSTNSSTPARKNRHSKSRFTKDSFFYNLQKEMEFYNALELNYHINVSLTKEEKYYPLPWREDDGWARGFLNNEGVVGVAGPKDNIEEVYFLYEEKIFDVNHSDPLEAIRELELDTFLLSFESCLFQIEAQKNEARVWISTQSINTQNEQTSIGGKILRTDHDYNFTDNYHLFGVFVSGEPKPSEGLPWWTYVGIVGSVIGISTAFYKIGRHFYLKDRKKNEMEEMPSKYSLNQKGAVVTVTFAAVWALLSMIIAIDMGLQSTFALAIFGIMALIAWILVPLYVKRIKAAYVLGVILLVLGLVGLKFNPPPLKACNKKMGETT